MTAPKALRKKTLFSGTNYFRSNARPSSPITKLKDRFETAADGLHESGVVEFGLVLSDSKSDTPTIPT